MKFNIKRFAVITFGVLIMALGLYFFLMPEDLAAGGVTGLAIVLNTQFPQISTGTVLTISNIILFVLGFLLIGADFGGYTVYASFLLSGSIFILEKLVPITAPLVNDIFINFTYGILTQAFGMGLVFSQNASTGGTDILAKIINKYTHMEIGQALLIADFVVFILAGITFGLRLALYGLLGIILNSFVVDKLIANINAKIHIIVISEQHQIINDYILHDIDRGTTLYAAGGGFTKGEKTIISTVVNKKEYIAIREFTKKIDPKAFIKVGKVTEVHGSGFTF